MCNEIQTEAQHLCICEWVDWRRHSLRFTGTWLYFHAPTPLHPSVCHYGSLIALICVYVYRMCGRVHARVSEIVIWGCWLGSEKEPDKCAKLVAGCSQTVRGNRPAEDWGGRGRGCWEAMCCYCHMSRLARQRASGRRARKTPPTGNCGCGGWVSRMAAELNFFPRLYQREKVKCREIDLPPTIRIVAHTLCVPHRERERERDTYILYICTVCMYIITHSDYKHMFALYANALKEF